MNPDLESGAKNRGQTLFFDESCVTPEYTPGSVRSELTLLEATWKTKKTIVLQHIVSEAFQPSA